MGTKATAERVAVLGATGAVGGHVVSCLVSEGYPVSGLARRAAQGFPVGCDGWRGDIQDPAAVDAAVSDSRIVVNAIGIAREGPGQSFDEVHVAGARIVVAAARKVDARLLIHLTGVRPNVAKPDPLSQSKVRAEEIVRGSGVPFVILRSSMVVGMDPSILHRIRWASSATRPFSFLPGGGRGLFQPLWIDDLVSCVMACIQEQRGLGQMIDLGGAETWSYRDLVKLVERLGRMPRLHVSIPAPLLSVLGRAPALIGMPPAITRTEIAQLCADNRVDPREIERVFGFRPRGLSEVVKSADFSQGG
ncbi:MAG: NAD(P)H-binding protein [Chloroflexi bacterium]|nr:NAD(P)H-binding protein [Chloroflexota bacterium]